MIAAELAAEQAALAERDARTCERCGDADWRHDDHDLTDPRRYCATCGEDEPTGCPRCGTTERPAWHDEHGVVCRCGWFPS